MGFRSIIMFLKLILILLLLFSLAGCSLSPKVSDLANRDTADTSPDTLLNAERQVIFSYGLDESNLPLESLSVFTEDVKEIFATFSICDNRDSEKAIVTWLYEDALIALQEIDIFISYSETTPQSFHSVLEAPDDGFQSGNYYVVASINQLEFARAGFIIE
jgi:hypothetical protein